MKKKKLQLEDLKVKSFVTIVNKEEQRTAKGGYVYKPRVASAIEIVLDTGHWTSEKTRATSRGDLLAGLRNSTKRT